MTGRKLIIRGVEAWFDDAGKFHRENGPAVIHPSGTTKWYMHGVLHRIGGPAIQEVGLFDAWFKDGGRHRDDGPAIEYADGDKIWLQNGKRHRTDGPAVELSDGRVEWWFDDDPMSLNDWLRNMKTIVNDDEIIMYKLKYG